MFSRDVAQFIKLAALLVRRLKPPVLLQVCERRRIRRVCINILSRYSLRCTHTQRMALDEDSCQPQLRHLNQLDRCVCMFEQRLFKGLSIYNVTRQVLKV